MSFNQVAATGLSTIGTIATVGIAAGVANNVVRTLDRRVPRGSFRRVYNPKRSMGHKSIYKRTPRMKGYSIF